MNQPIYYVCNRGRKDQFAIETLIVRDGSQMKVEKRPLYEVGTRHVTGMIDTYTELMKMDRLKAAVKVTPSFSEPKGVSSPFMIGRGVERILAEALMAGDEQQVLALIDKVQTVIDSLPATNLNPAQSGNYLKVFGANYNKVLGCVSFGLVDLNFDNFIVDKTGQWHLFDYEWAFSFPVAKDYLIQRLLFWSFVVRYRDLVLLNSPKYSLTQIADEVFIPEFVYHKYRAHFDSLNHFAEAEWNLHNYITKNLSGDRQSSKLELGIVFFAKPQAASPQTIAAAKLKLNIIEQFEQLDQNYRELAQSNEQLTKQLDEIVSSKAYKLARKMQTAKRRLSR